MPKKNALVLSPVCPYPLNRGDRIRLHHIIEILSKRYSVNLLYLNDEKNDTNLVGFQDENIVSKRAFPLKRSVVALKMLINVAGKEPILVKGFYSRKLSTYINDLLKNGRFDLVLIYGLRMFPYVEETLDNSIVIDFVDAVSMNLDRERRAQRNPIRRIYVEANFKKMLQYEQKVKDRCPHTLVSSETDFKWLGLDGRGSIVIPNCVDTEYFYFGKPEVVDMKRITFLGNMEYYPNQEAVMFLADQVLPEIHERFPDVKLLILGNNPGKRIKRLGMRRNIEVSGFVPDIRPFLENSALLVAPLNIGSGTKIKILQSMSMGLPVVCSSLANEGIKGDEGDGVFTADLNNDFSNKVIQLLENKEHILSLRSKSRIFIEKNFSIEVIEASLLDYLSRI